MLPQVEKDVRRFIEENFLFREDRQALGPDESLLDAGLIDSTGILELVAFIEGHFGVAVADAEIVPGNLDSLRAITGFVGRKLAQRIIPAAAE